MPSPTRRTAIAAALALTVAAAGLACSDDGGPSACGPVLREALDPSYLVHVVGAGEDVTYASDPPTSGPHQGAPAIEGAVDEAIPRPVQVGILERGDVLIQHAPDLAAADRAELASLAGPRVVVAPNPDLPDLVVATAWTYKRTCGSVALLPLQEFIDQRAGHGPEA